MNIKEKQFLENEIKRWQRYLDIAVLARDSHEIKFAQGGLEALIDIKRYLMK